MVGLSHPPVQTQLGQSRGICTSMLVNLYDLMVGLNLLFKRLVASVACLCANESTGGLDAQ